MKKANKKQNVAFAVQVLDRVKPIAKSFGLKAPEYIRHIVINDIVSHEEKVEKLSKEEIEELRKAYEDVKAGRVTVLKSRKDIDNHFKNL